MTTEADLHASIEELANEASPTAVVDRLLVVASTGQPSKRRARPRRLPRLALPITALALIALIATGVEIFVSPTSGGRHNGPAASPSSFCATPTRHPSAAADDCPTLSPSHLTPSSGSPAQTSLTTPNSTGATGTTPSAIPACGPSSLAIHEGPRLSPATGEHGVIIAVSTEGPPCTVVGYPSIQFTAGDTPIPFTYHFGKGQYVSHRPPQPVTLGGGKIAYFLVAKYRCDVAISKTADGMEVSLPRQGNEESVPRTWLSFSIEYCAGGANDPGNTVEVSPIVPSSGMLGQ